MKLLLAHLCLAILVMVLAGSASPLVFLFGLAGGWLILAAVPAQGSGKGDPVSYGRRSIRVLRLIGMFLVELAFSAFAVARLAIKPRPVLRAGLFAFPLRLQRDGEIALLANLITLTPGTLSVDVSPDKRILYIHAIDCADPEAARKAIRDGFEQAILEAFG